MSNMHMFGLILTIILTGALLEGAMPRITRWQQPVVAVFAVVGALYCSHLLMGHL
jgi:hypothetical protein